MKKRRSIIIICFMMVFLLQAMNVQVFADTVVSVTSISLNKMTDALTVNGVDTLIATVYPTTATNQAVTWTSSNTNVVKVFNGVVVAVSPGTALITAITGDGYKTSSCMVVVSQADTSISLNKASTALTIFGNETLIATVNQNTGTSQNVTWASSNTAIVQVANGVIFGVGAGTAVITATSANATNIVSCVVKVTSPVISINLNKTSDYLTVGGSDVLTVSVNPPTSTNQVVTWASSDTSKVQVIDGVIIAVSAGSAAITATTADGSKTASCSVIVNSSGTVGSKVTSISLNKTSDTLNLGSIDTLIATINPSTASNQNIAWSSSNIAIAKVANGVVIPVSAGSAIITATSADGYKTASCIVVVNAASNISIIRLGGADRYQTATAISQSGWKTTSSYAVLATGNDYPDALSAAPLAKKYNAPILLTDKNSIPQTVITELKRLSVAHIFITGGTGVVTQSIENQLNTMGIATERLGGADRFETSIKIAEKLGVVSGEIMVTNGMQYADALSASSIAAKKGIPIILTNKDALPDPTNTFISNKSFTKTYILGDTDLISNYVANKFSSIERIVGSDQYERNINIIKRFESDINFKSICVATGKDFPDALSGSAIAAMNSTAIVLVDDSNLKNITTNYISGKLPQVNNVYIFGQQGAVSDATVNILFKK
ncbi:cell wall-binding repeat-containing protein [Clostridium bowmanii]|uniref:cell wall-binding repeat-containing protein n=1 Tax=Clostridium bowmanii TaxID=132925 RepID=UPI001C0D8709|nr:cell wall-binding repeat-containing protein [Clostridium bowmanii]MBU3190273.1 cell wall-binding repeat-containing protein [Clostridium bowmanii]MCA1072515.1 cell wall-binding repeat-containing protein [Clostridium bowmanii]